jgi:hypothetical protein
MSFSVGFSLLRLLQNGTCVTPSFHQQHCDQRSAICANDYSLKAMGTIFGVDAQLSISRRFYGFDRSTSTTDNHLSHALGRSVGSTARKLASPVFLAPAGRFSPKNSIRRSTANFRQ